MLSALTAMVLTFSTVGNLPNPLEIIGDGSPGSTIVVNVDLDPNSPCWLGVSRNQGNQQFGSLQIDLGNPLVIIPLGTTDSTGFISVSFPVMANLPPHFSGLVYYAQAATLDQGDWSTSPMRTFTFPVF